MDDSRRTAMVRQEENGGSSGNGLCPERYSRNIIREILGICEDSWKFYHWRRSGFRHSDRLYSFAPLYCAVCGA